MLKSKTATMLAATALLVAVFGSTPLGHAAAGIVLPENSVGAAQLKRNAVGGKKIAKNAVTGTKVKNGTLTAADFKAGQLPAGPQGPKGDKGDPGSQGPKGDRGDPGSPGLSGYQIAEGNGVGLNPGAEGISVAYCPVGKNAVGGGVSGNARLAVIDSFPSGATGWRVFARNVGANGGSFAAYAVCATIG
jgi:hypothetical protein